ncbi:hypothetical protein G6F35_016861 [Rhizopus arrhizus]|nr:hypothetical protein G6F35_016861 [Rhizopus arrhizus]KAG1259947.1 hypothetical protein G6F65_015177 [Rhizopus arrhizus]
MDADTQSLQCRQHAEVALGLGPVVGDLFDGADQRLMVLTELQRVFAEVGAVGHAQYLQHAGRIHLLDAGGIDAGQLFGNATQDFGRGQRGFQGPGAGQADQARVMGVLFELGGEVRGHLGHSGRSITGLYWASRRTRMNFSGKARPR